MGQRNARELAGCAVASMQGWRFKVIFSRHYFIHMLFRCGQTASFSPGSCRGHLYVRRLIVLNSQACLVKAYLSICVTRFSSKRNYFLFSTCDNFCSLFKFSMTPFFLLFFLSFFFSFFLSSFLSFFLSSFLSFYFLMCCAILPTHLWVWDPIWNNDWSHSLQTFP